MKSLLFIIIHFLFFILVTPALAADGDYKKMLSEFENFHLDYRPRFLNKEGEQPESTLGFPDKDVGLDELQRRWDQLVEGVFEKDSYLYLSGKEWEELKVLKTNEEMAVNYLNTHQDIDSYLKLAFIRNLHLQSVKKGLEAKLESYPQVIQLEDILSQFSSFVKELDIKAGPKLHQTSIRQSYPFPGALSLKAGIAAQEVRIAKEKYEIALRDTVTQIKETFYEGVFLAQAVRITEEHIMLLQDLETAASMHYRTGKGGFNDVIKAQIKISKFKDDLVNLKEEKRVIEAKMAWFFNISSLFYFAFPSSPQLVSVSLSVQELIDIAFNHQQELRLLLEEIKKSEMAIELAEKKYYPDLSPGFSYFEDRKGSRIGTVKTDESFVNRPDIQPPYWFGRNDAYIREARSNFQALNKALENHKEELRYKVKEFLYELDKAERAVKLFENSLMPLAQNALEVSIGEYKTGKTDFLSLLDAETTLLNFGIGYQSALRNYRQNNARLEQLIGRQISELEVKNESPN